MPRYTPFPRARASRPVAAAPLFLVTPLRPAAAPLVPFTTLWPAHTPSASSPFLFPFPFPFPFLFLFLLLSPSPTAAQTVIFQEAFDAVTAPAAPAGWTLGTGWETSTSSASTGSGLNNLTSANTQPASATLPAIDLTGATSGTLSYLARRTSTFAADSLAVTASTDGGATFPIVVVAAGAALPATSSAWESISSALPADLLGAAGVIFRFEGKGTGGNARFDDVTVTATVSGTSTFGFAADASTALEETATVEVPMYLDFNSDVGLQGLQLRLSWSATMLTATGVQRGAAVADPALWSLEFEEGSGFLNVVLLGGAAAQLATGLYDPLLTLTFRTDSVAADTAVAISLDEVVGGLASPEAGDAVLSISPALHTMTLRPRQAFFVASADSVDFGNVAVGDSASAAVTVSNTGGTVDLEIGPITVDNPLFTLSPAAAAIAPDGSANFSIRFVPTNTAFGVQQALFTLANNSVNGTAVFPVRATGLGGRGDAEGDGAVDVLDLVHAVDFVLQRLTPNANQIASTDIYPFPDGDGTVDIRDLIVLVHAIARGYWPDNVDLPEEAQPLSEPAKAGGSATVAIAATAAAATVEMSFDAPIRGFQMIVRSDRELQVSAGGLTYGTSMLSGFDEADEEARIVLYRTDGQTFRLSDIHLRIEGPIGRPIYVVIVDEERRRVPVEINYVEATSAESDTPAEEKNAGTPYPNPFVPGVDAVHVPVAQQADVRVVDMLGREVARLSGTSNVQWNGRNHAGTPVSSGVYFLIIRSESHRMIRRVVAY